MHLLAVRCSPAEAELITDRCWQAGAAGLWEQVEGSQIVVRMGVDDDRLAAALAALADLSPVDVTDEESVDLATRHVVLAGTGLTLTVPPTVFGDGAHPTTAACIAALGRLVTPGCRVLDVGCGTGALSIVAASLGATVTAIDVDAAAVAATEANAAANGLMVNASTTPLARLEGAHDVVVANIAAGALLSLAPDLVDRCGRHLVVSGILRERWDEVQAALGGQVVDLVDIEGWRTATLEIRPAGS